MDNNEIRDIVEQLQRLQIQQASLVDRLSRAAETLPNVVNDEPDNRRARIPTDNPRQFAIGDRVRINNPRILQQPTGTVIRITEARMTVQTSNGGTVTRTPKNLTLIR